MRAAEPRENRVPGISAVPHEDNLRYFDVTVHGPSQSPYEGTSPNTRAKAVCACTKRLG